MLADARRVELRSPIECDVCVVGGGPAGIALALELASDARSVCMLEAGGLRHERRSQSLLAGDAVGCTYPELLETRSAMLGGSTGVWAGWCRPLDPVDFEPRDWVPGSGWPFPRDELLPFYRRAHELCGLGDVDYDANAWAARTALDKLPLDGHDFESAMFHTSALKFGIEYRPALERNPRLRVLLHAVALKLERSASGNNIARVRAGTLNGRRFDVVARQFVLAAGGIENARLLLLSGDSPEQAIGNQHGLVGRYFMEHGFMNAGSFVASDPGRSLAFHFPFAVDGGRTVRKLRSVFAVSARTQRERRLLNGAIFFHPAYEAHDVFDSPEVQALLEIGNKLRGRAVPGGMQRRAVTALRSPRKLLTAVYRRVATGAGSQRRWRTRALFECVPDRDNRVTLANDKDAFGRPLARLEWRPGSLDIDSARAMHGLFDASLRAGGLGHFEPRFTSDVGAWRAGVEGGKHHMGTTRMHRDPRYGVVDADCRVHGTGNLYAAGSSVFPTGGYANPTLTLVALAARLAQHLQKSI